MDLTERPKGSFRRHPWEISRYEFFHGILWRHLGPRPLSVLDAGAGDGWFASMLAEGLPGGSGITCWDRFYSEQDVRRLSTQAGETVRFTRERPDGRFDVALLLDVLEHVEDDGSFLSSIVDDNLEPGGHLLVSVPAWPILYSRHDAALHHHRRYTPRDCLSLIERSGIEVLGSGGLFHSLVPARAARKIREIVPVHDPGPPPNLGDWRHGPLATGLVVSALRFDNLFSRLFARAGVQVPGTSFWAIARR